MYMYIDTAIRQRHCHICKKKIIKGTQHFAVSTGFVRDNYCAFCTLTELKKLWRRALRVAWKEIDKEGGMLNILFKKGIEKEEA